MPAVFQREPAMRGRYKIAGKVIEVNSLYPLVQAYCAEQQHRCRGSVVQGILQKALEKLAPDYRA